MEKPGVQLQAGKEDTAFLDDVDGGKKAAAKADSTCPVYSLNVGVRPRGFRSLDDAFESPGRRDDAPVLH